MKNFIPYSEQDKILPALFIGYIEWPFGWEAEWKDGEQRLFYVPYTPIEAEHHGRGPFPVEVKLPPEIVVTKHQTGGVCCHHHGLIGVCFELGSHDPLLKAAQSYYHSNIATPVPWECLKRWEAEIAPLGVDFDGLAYLHWEEAIATISAESAFRYAKSNALGILTADGRKPWPEQWKHWSDLRNFLCGIWDKAAAWRPWGTEEVFGVGPMLFGAIVYENSD